MEQLEERLALTVPFGAMPLDTAEFMLGSVAVTVVALESTGASSTEDWTAGEILSVKQKAQAGAEWWVDTLRKLETDNNLATHPLSFEFDYTWLDAPVATQFEPINGISDNYWLWGRDFLNAAGVQQSGGSPNNFHLDLLAFNHSQRVLKGTDWAFTIFVVDDTFDEDKRFDSSGTFSQAFAFAGGQFFVTPASRPESTFAHELGHIFYAFDEYAGGASFSATRGYYDTQNLNGLQSAPPGTPQEPSIMTSGGLMVDAFNNHVSSPSTLALVGWQDSDGDGFFDVIDVPHVLTGSGNVIPGTSQYHFVGEAKVAALPNLNSWPTNLKNDITINVISGLEFRVDGGAWQTAQTYGGVHQTAVDVSFNVPAGFQSIEIRAFDGTTGIKSNVFTVTQPGPTSTPVPGIGGFVRHDANANGQLEPNELGVAGWTVRLVDATGQPIDLQDELEPDSYPAGPIPDGPHVTLTAIGDPVVLASSQVFAGTGVGTGQSLVFRNELSSGQSASWQGDEDSPGGWRALRINFPHPGGADGIVSTVSIDAIGNSLSGGLDYGRLEIYDSDNNLLSRYVTGGLAQGQRETMVLMTPTAQIAYAIATGHARTDVQLDSLRFGPLTETVTNAQGAYSFPSLLPGDYFVNLVPGNGSITTPATRPVNLPAGGQVQNIDFGVTVQTPPWQNPNLRFDVTADGLVDFRDVIAVVNNIRSYGFHPVSQPPGASPPPYVDVTGNGVVNFQDVLDVVNYLRNPGNFPPPGSGEFTGGEGEALAGEGERQAAFVSSTRAAAAEFVAGPPLAADIAGGLNGRPSGVNTVHSASHSSGGESLSGTIAFNADSSLGGHQKAGGLPAPVGNVLRGEIATRAWAVDALFARLGEAANHHSRRQTSALAERPARTPVRSEAAAESRRRVSLPDRDRSISELRDRSLAEPIAELMEEAAVPILALDPREALETSELQPVPSADRPEGK